MLERTLLEVDEEDDPPGPPLISPPGPPVPLGAPEKLPEVLVELPVVPAEGMPPEPE
jgi:hypothetical protein